MIDPASFESRPGPLRGAARLLLQTRQAQLLVRGRSGDQRPPIIGLLRFAALARTIHTAAEQGDPYAEWWLLRMEQALNQATEELITTYQQQHACLSTAPFEVRPLTSTEPVQVPLQLACQCAFRGAALLAEYDKTVIIILTADHYALLTHAEAQRLLNLAGRSVRRAFNSVVGYQALGLTREDIQRNTVKAQQAREQMGPLPEAILSGEQRANYGPRRTLKLKSKDPAATSPSPKSSS